MNNKSVVLKSEQDTKNIAAEIADYCQQKTTTKIIYLLGNLGAGKTTFSRYFIQKFGYTGKVKSPTYNLIENYSLAKREIFHLDLYRLASAEELNFLGLEDILNQPGVIVLIEWPEKGEGLLPAADIKLNFNLDAESRTLKVKIIK